MTKSVLWGKKRQYLIEKFEDESPSVTTSRGLATKGIISRDKVMEGRMVNRHLIVAVLTVAVVVFVGNAVMADTVTLSTSFNDSINISLSSSSFDISTEPGSSERPDTLSLRITNEGTENISTLHVWTDVLDTIQENPLGSNDPKQYAAGTFLTLRPNTTNGTNGDYHYVGRLLWNNSEEAGGIPSGITTPEDNPKAWGFYTTEDERYVWTLSGNGSKTTESFCNQPVSSTGTNNSLQTDHPALVMKNIPDRGTNRDLSLNSTLYTFTDAIGEWAVTRAENGPLAGNYIAAHRSCERMYVYRYDGRGRFPFSAAKDHHAFEGTVRPGETLSLSFGMEVPPGVPAGDMQSSTISIEAR